MKEYNPKLKTDGGYRAVIRIIPDLDSEYYNLKIIKNRYYHHLSEDQLEKQKQIEKQKSRKDKIKRLYGDNL